MRGIADESFAFPDSRDTEGLSVRFEKRPKRNEKASLEAGRPIYDEVDYIEIRAPGDKDNIVHRPVTESDKLRFATQYRRWQSTGGDGEALTGTPLAEWPAVSRSQVEELRYFGVRTVEQLAAVTDGNLKNVGPLLMLRQKARDFVAKAKDEAPMAQMRDELAAKDMRIAHLEAQMAEVLAEAKKSRKSKEA